MTWNTSCGERVLSKAEARLFTSAIGTIIDNYNTDLSMFPDDTVKLGIVSFPTNFTQLNAIEQLTVLFDVATALIFETDECPKLNHINEAAIAYVYDFIKSSFDNVSDDEDVESLVWGKNILDAYNEVFEKTENHEDIEEKKLSMESKIDRDDWVDMVTNLEEQILWDRDFEYYETCDKNNLDDYVDDNYFSSCHLNIRVNQNAEDLLYDLVREIETDNFKKRKNDKNNNNTEEKTQHKKSKKNESF